MTEEDYDKALTELYLSGQSSFDKYLRRAELLHSQGHHIEKDTLELAVKMFWKERNI